MITLQFPASKTLRILCLGAHSDDIEIGCGGTILALLDKYAHVAVRWAVFSSDEERAREATQGADAFLARAAEKEVTVGSHRDGFFPWAGDRIKEEFEELARGFTPDVVFTHFRDDRHQDHRVISDLTWNSFRNHCVLEYEIPKYDGDLGQPNFFVPLERATCETKVKHLLECFDSQRRKRWFDEETFFALMRLRGMESNSPTRFAEAFHCRKAVLGWPA
jgi:LmbE family N-acetylglucosaminyl deacetylase